MKLLRYLGVTRVRYIKIIGALMVALGVGILRYCLNGYLLVLCSVFSDTNDRMCLMSCLSVFGVLVFVREGLRQNVCLDKHRDFQTHT